MEQDNTNSGNPDGYVPQNRYIPPSMDPLTGLWSTQGLSYSVPQAYGMGQAGMPTGPTPMPMFNQQQHPGQQLSPQQQAAVSGAGPGMMPANNNNYPTPQFQGNAQPPVDMQAAYGQQQANYNNMLSNLGAQASSQQQQPSNSLVQTYKQLQGNTPSKLGPMPQFTTPSQQNPNDTYLQHPHMGGNAALQYNNTAQGPVNAGVAQPMASDRLAIDTARSVGIAQTADNASPAYAPTTPHKHMPRFGERMMAYPQGHRVRGTEYR
jgi:hypothetical protein